MCLKHMKSYYRLPFRDRILFLEACLFLHAARLMLLVLPFRICIRTIRKEKGTAGGEFLVSVKRAILRATRTAFWKNICLTQSFAARWMLQRRGIHSVLSIGVRHDPRKKLNAHAWLIAGRTEIVPRRGAYTTLKEY